MYTNQSGDKISLGSEIAKGGEGIVFNIDNDNDNCVKIYRDSLNTPEREDKLKYMVLNPPPEINGENHKICWPKDIIYKDGKFVGFLMTKSFDNSLLPYHLCQPEISKKLDSKWHSTYDRETQKGIVSRLKLCVNIIAAVNRIHSINKYVIVDLKPQNLLITYSGKVSIIDMDSIQIAEDNKVLFNAPVSTPEYTPPEAITIVSKKSIISKDWDVFSLGVLVYEMLFGIHPFVGSANPPYDNLNTIQEKIKINLTHVVNGEQAFNILPKPHNLFYSYPSDFKNIFKKIFGPYIEGESKRPDLEILGGVLFNTIKEFEESVKKEEELVKNEALKKYPALKIDYANLKSRYEEIQVKFDKYKIDYANLKSRYEEIQVKFDKYKNENTTIGTDIKQKSSNSNPIIIILIIILVGVSFMFYSKITSNKELITSNKELNRLLVKEYEDKNEISASNPIIISDIKFHSKLNGSGFYGLKTNLPYREIGHLSPTIEYFGVKAGYHKLDVKIHSPDGLNKGTNSPRGYSYSSTATYERGRGSKQLSSWGNDRGGNYLRGYHTIEIWYEGKILFERTFRVK